MFLGHFAVAFAAKRLMPNTSLGTLTFATLWPDLIWPILLLAGVEKVYVAPGATEVSPLIFAYYPYSHSLVTNLFWALLIGGGYAFFTRSTHGLMLGGVVLSHWILDVIAHSPDMPILIGDNGMVVGMGLWNSAAGTVMLEGMLFVGAFFFYLASMCGRGWLNDRRPFLFAALLGVIYATSVLGPTPPTPTAVAIGSLMLWLLIPMAAWADRCHTAEADACRKARRERRRATRATGPGPDSRGG